MIFYPSKNHAKLNGREFAPEAATGRAMLNPHYPVRVPGRAGLVSDSGAIQISDLLNRVSPDAAIDRQLRQRDFVGQPFEAIVTYDAPIGVDEVVVDGRRKKRRGTEATAGFAVEETVRSAEVYASRRADIAGPIAWAVQGVSTEQYLECARRVLAFADPQDWIALGGFCIVGVQTSLKPLLYAAARGVVSLCLAVGIRRVHVLGVTAWDCLLVLREIERESGILFSTDSSSIEVNSIMGKVWDTSHMVAGRSPWRKVWGKEDKGRGYHPRDLAIANIERFNTWLTNLP